MSEVEKNVESIQLLKLDEGTGKFILDCANLEKLLLSDDIKDRSIVIISIAGAFRKGKSFLLSFFLRYLNFKYKKPSATPLTDAWMGSANAPLKGFTWKCGRDRVTTGIQMWPEIFCTTLPDGEKVALMLLDTQGMFDNVTTFETNAKIFALSTLISSCEIYNLSQHIQEDNLQLLKFFTDYGSEAASTRGNMPNAPFGKLLFLVRDWQFADETGYGYDGGRKLIQDILKVKEDQKPELQSVRRLINLSFSDIDGFLMPHPGFQVAENSKFDGRLSEIRKEFLDSLQELLPSLLAPENLILKQIEGRKVKAFELVQYISLYVNKLNSDKMPTPRGIIDANAEMSYRLAYEAGVKEYKRIMDIICGNPNWVDGSVLSKKNRECSESAFAHFRDYPKFRNEILLASYQKQVKEEIARLYALYCADNQKKREINDLKSSVTTQSYEIRTLRNDTESQRQRIEDLRESERKQQRTISDLQASERYQRDRISNIEGKYYEYITTTARQEREIRDLNQQNSSSRNQISQLHQKLQEKEAREKELAQKVIQAVTQRSMENAPQRRKSWSNE